MYKKLSNLLWSLVLSCNHFISVSCPKKLIVHSGTAFNHSNKKDLIFLGFGSAHQVNYWLKKTKKASQLHDRDITPVTILMASCSTPYRGF